MLTLVFACILFASCKKHEVDAYAEVDNVVLVYMAAENSLCSYADGDIYEMCVGARKMSKRDRVIVYVDDNKSPRIYELRDTTQYKYLTPVKSYNTDWMSTSAEALNEVMTYVHGTTRLIITESCSGRMPMAGFRSSMPCQKHVRLASTMAEIVLRQTTEVPKIRR